MKLIRANVSQLLVTTKFQEFVCDYLERVNPIQDAAAQVDLLTTLRYKWREEYQAFSCTVEWFGNTPRPHMGHSWVHVPSIRSQPVCIYLFRQNPCIWDLPFMSLYRLWWRVRNCYIHTLTERQAEIGGHCPFLRWLERGGGGGSTR